MASHENKCASKICQCPRCVGGEEGGTVKKEAVSKAESQKTKSKERTPLVAEQQLAGLVCDIQSVPDRTLGGLP